MMYLTIAIEKMECLISPFLRHHYVDTRVEGQGYMEYRWEVRDLRMVVQEWQVSILHTGVGSFRSRLPFEAVEVS